MSPGRIVVVEDEPDLLCCLVQDLGARGYRVTPARDAREGLAAVRRETPDVVLLDRLLPDLAGDEVCRRLRADPLARGVGIVLVTALGGEDEVATGLSLGADDYLRKPFSLIELAARIEAVIRRGSAPPPASDPGERVGFGPLVVDLARHEVRLDGQRIALTATELRMLQLLLGRPGRTFTRAQILDFATEAGPDLLERNVDVRMAAIRHKLGAHRDLIETVRGIGYRLRDE